MVDSQDPNSILAVGDAATFAQSALNNLSDATTGVRNVLENLNNKIINFKSNLELSNNLTNQQTTAFGLLSTTLLGVKKSFDNLSGVDTSYLNTFSGQITDLQKIIMQDSSLPSMADKATALAASLVGLGVPAEKLKEILGKGAGAVFDFANNLAISADNGLRLQNAYIQLSGATGNLNSIFSAAGPNLNKINLLLAQQQKMISDTGAATGLTTEVITEYYSELARVPQALSATVSVLPGTTEKTSALTAAIRVATGSGRSFSDVVDDMKSAFRNYNIVGEDALKFTGRISEISNKFGIELSDVKDALKGTSDQFKMFGNEAEGAARIYNQYLGALQSTGVSGHVAVDVVKGMVNGIKDLTIAQKGFLSAQTGGAGGLMGAFQIEKELRDGKIDKVFDRVRATLNKQFGSIVSLEEASQSQAAAARLTKQIQVLQQGPLGSFARDDQSAIRILESFRNKDQGKSVVTDLSQTVVQDTSKIGLELEQKSYTELSRIRSILENVRNNSNISNLGLLQNMGSAGTGTPTVDSESASLLRDNLRQNMKQSTLEGGNTVAQYANDLVNKNLKDRTGQFAANLIDNFTKLYNELGPSLKAPVEELRRLVNSGDAEGASRTYQDYLQRLDEEKNAAMTLSSGIRSSQLEEIEKNKNSLAQAYTLLSQENVTPGTSLSKTTNLSVQQPNVVAENKNVNTVNTSYTPQKLGEIMVHVDGFCISCNQKINNHSQSYAVNVGQKVDK